jgi:hypothetical protein
MPVAWTHQNEEEIPVVRAAILLPVLEAFRRAGYEPGLVLEPHGLLEAGLGDPASFILHDTVYSVYNTVADHTEPTFCAAVGRALEWSAFVPFSEMLAEAVTLSDFVTRFASAVTQVATSSMWLIALINSVSGIRMRLL